MSVFMPIHTALHAGFRKALDVAKKHPAATAVGLKAATSMLL